MSIAMQKDIEALKARVQLLEAAAEDKLSNASAAARGEERELAMRLEEVEATLRKMLARVKL